jgi:hypothetical protein
VSRAVDRFDRLMVALAGVALIVVGLGCMVWSTRSTPWWPQWIQQLPDRVSIGAAVGWLASPWWPWVSGTLAFLLALVAVRWLVVHLPAKGVGYLRLPDDADSRDRGVLLVDARAAADAAALALNSLPGIETAVGSLDDVDGQLVARIDATIEATADLREVGRSCDQVSAQLAQVLGRRDVAVRVTLRFGRANSSRVA